MMRLVYYSTTSVALAIGVVVNALHRRSNFYSACVYLAQSNACLMILTNVSLLAVSVVMLGLQKLLYGRLRPIEVEQLYEKAWFAITETCLAMTIFREEVGGWFFVMFVSLLAGKIWGWIGEGRVEVLEQQPPANPRLFHARLSTSLLVSTAFDMFMLSYTVGTVLQHARPNMMVMFAFEFAVLCVTSSCTCGRYMIYLREAQIIRSQIQARRIYIQRHRDSSLNANDAEPHQSGENGEARQSPELDTTLDHLDADVPGWEDKGKWIFYLDLATDFFKLILYLAFFCVLCMFYGMPIHIIRDVALTIRSFHKRVLDFIRYRQATRDMNTRYPDASVEEVNREDCCIICREEMKAWLPTSAQPDHLSTRDHNFPYDERLRPKKLPCGHVLHFTCLRSWLERQQNCPTCRAPVLTETRSTANASSIHVQQAQRVNAPPDLPPNLPAGERNAAQNAGLPNMFQFGPFRVLFGARNAHPLPNQRFGETRGAPLEQHPNGNTGRIGGDWAQSSSNPALAAFNSHGPTLAGQIQQIEQQLLRELGELQLHADHLQIVRALQNELSRLRHWHGQPYTIGQGQNPVGLSSTPSQVNANHGVTPIHQIPRLQPAFSANSEAPSLGSGHEHLPNGMTLPEGWTVLPLQYVPSNSVDPSIHSTSLNPFNSLPTHQSSRDQQQEQAGEPSQTSSPFTTPSMSQQHQDLKDEAEHNGKSKSAILEQNAASEQQASLDGRQNEEAHGSRQDVNKNKGKNVTVEDDMVGESN